MSMEPFFRQLQTNVSPTVRDTMKYEGLRLATFHSRPRAYNTPAPKLANAGFYYTGEEDFVECYICGLRVGSWSAMHPHVDPNSVHTERSPACAFLKDNTNENVPYAMNDSQLSGEAKILKDKISKRSASHFLSSKRSTGNYHARNFQQTIIHSNVGKQLARQSSIETDEVETASQPYSANNSAPKATAQAVRSTNSSSIVNNFGGLFNNNTPVRPSLTLPPAPPMFDNDFQGMPNFREEQVRLDTFNYWPNGSAVRPSELSKAGFYYLGTEDRVQCAFCKGVLRNWDPTDHALEEHKKHFPACPFIRTPRDVGNVPVPDQLAGVSLRKKAPTDQELEDYLLGIMTERALHPHMAMKIERLNSFVNFYSDSSKTPEEFSEAGFFFTGQGDNVKCFFCDGGLRNWERNDEPWLEHARWFPKCGYLRTKKGDEYVQDIRKKYAPPGTKKPRVKKLRARFEVKPEDLAKAMRSDMVKDAKDMGYEHSQIKDILQNRLAQLGTPFPNVESLITSLYEVEELQQQGSCSESESEESGEYLRCSVEPEKTENTVKQTPSENAEKKKKKKKKNNKKKIEPVVHVNPIELMSEENGDQLATEVQKLKDERNCKVCMDSEVNIVFLKCGHLVCCSDCAPALRHCPICRQTIRGTIRVFLS